MIGIRLKSAPQRPTIANNTWLLEFPEGTHPRDYKLTGVYLYGKNVKTKEMDWNFFDTIYCENSNGRSIDALGRVGKITYFLNFKLK